MEGDTPYVSLIMPVYNEENFLHRTLTSLLGNDYPVDRMELLVVDGRSTDRSRDIVLEFQRKCSIAIRLLDNPKRIIPAALNIGLSNAVGDIIIRVDAHTTYAHDYIRATVNLLQRSGAGCVGGLQRAVGETNLARAIAAAVSSPFAAGNAHYRYADREMAVDTVYLGAWRRETLLELGGWREELEVNEDYELNYRLRMTGRRILLSPSIRSQYHVRSTFAKLARQYFRYGYWKVRMLRLHPRSLRWRQTAAPLLVLGLIVSLFLAPWSPKVAVALPATYLMATGAASLVAGRSIGLRNAHLTFCSFVIIHCFWGLGFLQGLLHSLSERISRT